MYIYIYIYIYIPRPAVRGRDGHGPAVQPAASPDHPRRPVLGARIHFVIDLLLLFIVWVTPQICSVSPTLRIGRASLSAHLSTCLPAQAHDRTPCLESLRASSDVTLCLTRDVELQRLDPSGLLPFRGWISSR